MKNIIFHISVKSLSPAKGELFMNKREWLNDLPLPYSIKKEERLKEQIFFNKYTSEEEITDTEDKTMEEN